MQDLSFFFYGIHKSNIPELGSAEKHRLNKDIISGKRLVSIIVDRIIDFG